MPSFRATVQVAGMRPGHQPPEVLDTAVAALPEHATAEARSIEIAQGVPMIIVRFAVQPASADEEDAAAWAAGLAVRAGVDTVARAGGLVVTRRVGGRWAAVPPPQRAC